MEFIEFARCAVSRKRSGLPLAYDERLEHGFQRYFSLSRASLGALELDPAFVEAIKHSNSGCGVLHALRFEYGLPSFARHRFHSHRTAKQTSEGVCNLVRRHTMRSFQLD